MENKETRILVDLFGEEIVPGDFVISSGHGRTLEVYRVLRLTPKMVRVVRVTAKTPRAKKGELRYGDELLKIDGQRVTYYLMKTLDKQ